MREPCRRGRGRFCVLFGLCAHTRVLCEPVHGRRLAGSQHLQTCGPGCGEGASTVRTAALGVPVSGHRLPSCKRRREGRPGLPGSQGERAGSPGRSFAHSQLRTHSLAQAHVRAYTRMPEDAHSLTPTCTHSYMPCPHMPSSAHTDSLSCSRTHTQAHAHPPCACSRSFFVCSPAHTSFALKHTDTHRLPRGVLTHSLQGLRGPSVEPCALGKSKPGCR